MFPRERFVGEDITLGFAHQRRQLRMRALEHLDELSPLRMGGVGVGLVERRAQRRRDHRLAPLRYPLQCIAHEMHPAALPARAHDLAYRGLEALVGVGHDQLHAAQTPMRQSTQKLAPECLRFVWHHRDPQHLPAARAIHRHRNHDGDIDDATTLAAAHIGRVQPHIRPVTFQGTIQKGTHALVDRGTQSRHLALRDTAHAHRFHQAIHVTRRQAPHVSFLDHRHQRLLRCPPRLQKFREIAPPAKLRHFEVHRPRPRLPAAVTVAVTVVRPLCAALVSLRVAHALNIELHQPVGHKPQHLRQ